MNKLLGFTFTCSVLLDSVLGHGYMIDPPARTSLWRNNEDFPDAPTNYDDNQMFCGGFTVQQGNDGKCGVCGDSYSAAVRTAEPGPGNQYAQGIIAATYPQGSVMPITIWLTVKHKGFYEFKLCPNDVPQVGLDPSVRVVQECFDGHVLSGDDETSFLDQGNVLGAKTFNVHLPSDISCEHCVLQWRWKTGNSWGVGPDGVGGLGFGAQEEFWNCADIKIEAGSPTTSSPATTPTTASTTPLTTAVPSTSAPICTGINTKHASFDRYCATCDSSQQPGCDYLCECPGRYWSCTSSFADVSAEYCISKCTVFAPAEDCPLSCSCSIS